MTLPALATVDQLQTRLGDEIPAGDVPQAQSLIGYASALIRGHCRRTWTTEEGDPPITVLHDVPDGVSEVCVEVVFRAITNPTGVTQDTVGPFTVSFGADAAQRMYLSKSDREILPGRNRAFTIDPTPAAAAVPPLAGAWVNGPDGTAPGEWL